MSKFWPECPNCEGTGRGHCGKVPPNTLGDYEGRTSRKKRTAKPKLTASDTGCKFYLAPNIDGHNKVGCAEHGKESRKAYPDEKGVETWKKRHMSAMAKIQ